MNWYYLDEAGNVVGPIDESSLRDLRHNGVLKNDSQVCREGTEDWVSLPEVFGPGAAEDKPKPPELKFSCSHCGQHISAEASNAGLSTQCPACGEAIHVPDFEQSSRGKAARRRGSKAVLPLVLGFAILIVAGVVSIIARSSQGSRVTMADYEKIQFRGPNEEQTAYLVNSKTPYTGKIEKVYANGQKAIEGAYKDGKKDGLWTEWYENGQKMSEGHFKKGMEEGVWTEWHENGQKARQVRFDQGKEEGFRSAWYDNGQQSEENHFKEGMPDGPYTTWYRNGKKSSAGQHRRADRVGLWTEWSIDGRKTSERRYGDSDQAESESEEANRNAVSQFRERWEIAISVNPSEGDGANAAVNILAAIENTDWSNCSPELRTAAKRLQDLPEGATMGEFKSLLVPFMRICERYE